MTYRVACLGAGYFARFHRDGWARIHEVDLVGVADLDYGKAAATGYPAFASLAEMLDATKPDILDIVVPPSAHADAIRIALKGDLKLIICQKPFCTSLAEAREITALAKAKGVPLIIHENFRFQPWFRAIHAAIGAGAIGDPLQATFRLRPGDGQGADAYLSRQPYFQKMPRFLIHETGVHYVDTFRYLFGNPTAVYADLRQINPVIAGEDAGFVLFEHPNGMRTLFDGNRNLDHLAKNTRCTMGEGLFEGTQGTLTLLGDGSVSLRKFSEGSTIPVIGPDLSDNFGGDCTYHLQHHVIKALLTDSAFENCADDYMSVLEIENAIYDSAQKKQRVALNDHET